MAAKRKIEVFSAGCATCLEAIEVIQRAACPSCEVIIHDMRDGEVAKRANALGTSTADSAETKKTAKAKP
jgi:glutaredoxin 3